MIHVGDCLDILPTLPAESVQTCITSPPYFGLRDYGVDGQLGLEASPEAFLEAMVSVFREVRRVLRDDGTLWLNLGDSYATNGGPGWQGKNGQRSDRRFTGTRNTEAMREQARTAFTGHKPKDLMGIPWMVAFALRADGWYLRQDIIWHKPNPMPESVRDRCTKSHEYLFLLSKSERYYFDADAIKEPCAWDAANTKMPDGWDTGEGGHGSFHRNGREKGAKVKRPELARGFRGGSYVAGEAFDNDGDAGRKAVGNDFAPEGFKRNKRSVWAVATQPFKEAHFATYPPALIEPCVLAGSRPGDTVLDPFMGAGTTALVAQNLGRPYVGCELNPAYAAMAEARVRAAQPGLALGAA